MNQEHQPDAPAPPRSDVEAIAIRAYRIYLGQGSTEGHAVRDWLEAEAQVRSEQQSMGSRPAYSL
jgi:hypothetical protein